jgi:hypothetical protein
MLRRLLLAIFVTFGFQEVVARLLFPLPEVLNFDRVSYSPLLVGQDSEAHSRPSLGNASFVWSSEPDGVEFVHHLNVYGFRDRDWRLRKDPRKTRVAFIGDSLIEGFMANDNETIPFRFAEASEVKGEGVEVLNLGVGAASIGEYLRLARDAIPLFRPDTMVVVFYANDFFPGSYDPGVQGEPLEARYSDPFAPRLVYVLDAVRHGRRVLRRFFARPFPFLPAVPDPRNPWSDANRAAHLATVVHPAIADPMKRGRFNPYVVDVLRLLERNLLAPVDMVEPLESLQRFASASSTRLLVAYLPSRYQVTDHYLSYTLEYARPPERGESFTGEPYQMHARTLASSCSARAIPFLDLTPVLRRAETSGTHLYWNYDEHLRAMGYQVVARALFDWWSRTRRL